LFRDCGVPALLTRYPEYEQMLMQTRKEGEQRRCEMERAQFGFDHAVVGSTLAQSWHLPSETWQAIRVHADYAEPGFCQGPNARFVKLIALALLAKRLQRQHRGTFEADAWNCEDAFVAEVFGPTEERLQPLENDIRRILQHS
jgi:HD-like signal output (HDOD) protein